MHHNHERKPQILYTVLGSTGVIGRGFSGSLPAHGVQVRLVSRNPRRISGTDEIVTADPLDPAHTQCTALRSDVVSLAAGLRYHTPTWQLQWHAQMRSVLGACASTSTKLVFFDNVCASGTVRGWMKEEPPMAFSTRKGEVRRVAATTIMEEVRAGKVEALIARAADFYGPNTPLSVVHTTVFERPAKVKKALRMGDLC